MPIYIVAYDICKTTDRERLEVEIRNNFNDSCQINKSLWLLETVIDSPGISRAKGAAQARVPGELPPGDQLVNREVERNAA